MRLKAVYIILNSYGHANIKNRILNVQVTCDYNVELLKVVFNL